MASLESKKAGNIRRLAKEVKNPDPTDPNNLSYQHWGFYKRMMQTFVGLGFFVAMTVHEQNNGNFPIRPAFFDGRSMVT